MLQKTEYDYLLGRYESEAYELAQDAGLVVRITRRDDQYMKVTCDFKSNRINFEVTGNRVVALSIG